MKSGPRRRRWRPQLGVSASGVFGITADDLRRMFILLVVSTVCALLVVDYGSALEDPLKPGDVAQYTVRAPFNLTFPDEIGRARAQEEAKRRELPVFVHNAELLDDRSASIARAFAAGRAALTGVGWKPGQGVPPLGQEILLHVEQAFLDPLRVQLREADVRTLVAAGFPAEAEDFAREMLHKAMRDQLIVISRDQLVSWRGDPPADPSATPDRGAIRVIHLANGSRSEEVVADFEPILVPDEARQRITLAFLEASRQDRAPIAGPVAEAAANLARALVTANLQYESLETEERRTLAASTIPMEWVSVKRGQILIRAGEVVTGEDLELYRQFQKHDDGHHWGIEVLSISLFLVLLFGTLHHFVVAWAGGQHAKHRDLWTMGALLLLVAALARVTVVAAEPIASMIGYEAEPASVWFAVPVAGAVMLARVLIGTPWTFAFAVASAVVCGLVLDQQALPVAFYLITGVAGASAVENARERITILKAGVWVGVMGAVAVLLVHLVQLFVVDGEVTLATPMRPFWSMIFAFAGGLGSAFLVLSLIPLLEALGYVTDYRMMELANLDHPLLRQLMLRAPGSYHHSVIVGSLAEAGAGAIGANSLHARVSSYFHDIGKAVQPQYFVENQRGGMNKHTQLDPFTSAHVIIDHVVEGGRMAKEYNLPQPIIDNIYMHHGTGVLQYFYETACAQAADPSMIDEAAFRYPGPKPNTREAGVIMLADKVEAATRTLKVPDEAHLRSMIGRIVSSVISDGQFSDCPLTFSEIQRVTETFVRVLVGIYHQRVEYPATADLSRASGAPPSNGTITLELEPIRLVKPPPTAVQPQNAQVAALEDELPHDDTDVVDYESLDYLPRRG